MRTRTGISRRRFLENSPVVAVASGSLTALGWPAASGAEVPAPHQAMGTKVGEVTDTSAIVWTRLTASPARNNSGVPMQGRIGRKVPQEIPVPVEAIEGACPGAPGRVRVRYGIRADLSDATTTDWAEVSETTDFSHQFPIAGLRPATVYYYATETTGPGGSPRHGVFHGTFETAPPPTAPTELLFCVMTCQAYHDRDHKDGHNIYPAMGALRPRFVVFTGDNVYYDSEKPAR